MAGKEKVLLSLDRDLVAEIRRWIGKRELSSFLNEALERRLQADAVARYLDQTDQAAGAVPTDVDAGVDDVYARRFERTRNAKQRHRVVSTAV